MTNALRNNQFEDATSKLILGAFRKLVTPFVKLLLRNRIGFHTCMRVIKDVYVNVANSEEEFYPLARANQTKSNITLLTGIRRGDVQAILEESDTNNFDVKPLPESLVLHAWNNDPIFSDSGVPKVLPIGGKGCTFTSLVSKHGGGATHGPILDSLVSANCAEILPAAKVTLLNHIYTPALDDPDRINIAAISSVRLANTLLHNLEGSKPTVFQKELWSVSCPQERVEEFSQASKALLDEFLAGTEHLLSEFEELPPNPTHASVGVGIYAFTENLNP